jgi:hypothetical protein
MLHFMSDIPLRRMLLYNQTSSDMFCFWLKNTRRHEINNALQFEKACFRF